MKSEKETICTDCKKPVKRRFVFTSTMKLCRKCIDIRAKGYYEDEYNVHENPELIT